MKLFTEITNTCLSWHFVGQKVSTQTHYFSFFYSHIYCFSPFASLKSELTAWHPCGIKSLLTHNGFDLSKLTLPP